MERAPLAVLPPRLFGSVGYYDLMASYPAVFIDWNMRYDKREKAVHRYEIADTRGRLQLTVPVSRPESFSSGLCWSDVAVSAHGRWWEVQRIALESAYGRTPYFEFYIGRLADLFSPRPIEGERITDLCRRADEAVRKIMGMKTYVLEYLPEGIPFDDYRRRPIPEAATPYWQVREQLLGFIPNLSILDRIFNTGR